MQEILVGPKIDNQIREPFFCDVESTFASVRSEVGNEFQPRHAANKVIYTGYLIGDHRGQGFKEKSGQTMHCFLQSIYGMAEPQPNEAVGDYRLCQYGAEDCLKCMRRRVSTDWTVLTGYARI